MIIRIEKRITPFVMIDKRPIEDQKLSWRAKGVLTYLLSKPDGWCPTIKDLAEASSEGEWAVRKVLQELEANGYLIRRRVRGESGKIVDWEHIIYETPQVVETPVVENQIIDEPVVDLPHVEKQQLVKPHVVNQHVEEPHVVNSTQVIIDSSNNDSSNNTPSPPEETVDDVINRHSRYTDEQKQEIRDYWEMIRFTRKTGKISPTIMATEMDYWKQFEIDIVMRSLSVHVRKCQTKREEYTRGIMRRMKREHSGGNDHGPSGGNRESSLQRYSI